MNKKLRAWPRLIAVILFSMIFFQDVRAETFDYPELLVTPLASERIGLEVKREQEVLDRFMDHAPIMVSAGLTMLTATQLSSQKGDLRPQDQSDASDAAKVSLGVGAFWLGYTSYLAMTYRPYEDAQRSLSSYGAETPKGKLIRERLAEEKINEAASFGRTLSWFSSGTLLLSSVVMASLAKDDVEGYAVVSAVSALAPLYFSYRWVKVEKYHRNYKKRIYGPMVMSSVYGSDNKWAPMLQVSASF